LVLVCTCLHASVYQQDYGVAASWFLLGVPRLAKASYVARIKCELRRKGFVISNIIRTVLEIGTVLFCVLEQIFVDSLEMVMS
jgi:SOS response regulatory protein OraA/RecX